MAGTNNTERKRTTREGTRRIFGVYSKSYRAKRYRYVHKSL